MSLRKNNNSNDALPAPKIFIPYPQTLDPKEFLPKLNSRKPCNGFMIYRKVYQKQLNANAYRFKMATISRWASDLWLKENEKLKDAYREFALKILNDRLNAVALLAAPYIFRSQQFTFPPISPQYYYYEDQSFPSANLHLD